MYLQSLYFCLKSTSMRTSLGKCALQIFNINFIIILFISIILGASIKILWVGEYHPAFCQGEHGLMVGAVRVDVFVKPTSLRRKVYNTFYLIEIGP